MYRKAQKRVNVINIFVKSLRFFLITLLVFIGFNTYGQDYYWVGGSGNWSDITHWATTSGGGAQHVSVPSSANNVIFDANSFDGPNQIVTVNSPSVICLNMTWNGVTNSPTFVGTGDKKLQIFGSLSFSPDMAMDYLGEVIFNGTSGGLQIDLANHPIVNANFQSPVGGWTIVSPFTVIKTINIDGGNIDFSGQPLKVYNFNVRPTQMSTIDLTNCNVVFGYVPMSGSAPNVVANVQILSDQLNLVTTNSTINMPSQNAEMIIQGSQDIFFNVVNVTNAIGKFVLNDPAFISTPGSVHFNSLSLLGDGEVFGNNFFTELNLFSGNSYIFGLGYNQIIGKLNAAGQCDATINISSNVAGTSATFSFGTDQSISFVNLSGINAAGGGRYDVISGSDDGNNNGWTFDGSGEFDLFWIGGTGDWNDPNHWANTSGGIGGSCIPGPRSNVFFDANSFSAAGQRVNINIASAECLSMNWTGALFNPTLEGTSSPTLHIFGSLTLNPVMENLFLGKVSFESQEIGRTISSQGNTFLNEVIFNSPAGGWTFLDEFDVNNVINFKAGMISTNDQTINTDGFHSVSVLDRSLFLGNSTWNIAAPTSVTWQLSGPAFLLDAANSTINFDVLGVFFVNANANLQFNNVNFLANEATINTSLENISFQNLIINANAKLEGQFNAGILTMFPGKKYEFSHNTGDAFTIDNLVAIGECQGPINIKSGTDGVVANLVSSNNQMVDYVTLQDISISGGQSYIATNSTDRGNNSGWVISGSTSRDLYWVGGMGNWEDISHWSIMSGGTGGECLPTADDNVFFDVNSFTSIGQSVNTSNNTVGICRNMTWDNVQMNSRITLNQVDVFGSLVLDQNMDYSIKKLNLLGSASNTITTNNVVIEEMDILGTGDWTLNGDIGFDNISVFHGLFVAAGYNLNGNKFKGLNDAEIDIRNSILNLAGSGLGGTFNVDNELITLQAQGSSIFLTSSDLPSVIGEGNHQLDYVEFTSPDAQATVKSSRIGSVLGPTQQFLNFNTLIFSGNGELIGNNEMDSLIFGIGKSYILESESIQRIGTHWQVRGFQCLQLSLRASRNNVQALVEKSAGQVDGEFILMSDIGASGGANFFAGRYSNDLGGNTGWTFMERPDFSVEGILGDDFSLCPGQPVLLNGDNRLGSSATLIWNNTTTSNTYEVLTPGTITLRAVFDTGCELTDSVNVMAGPDLAFELGEDTTKCSDEPVLLNASVSEPGATYIWSNGSGMSEINVNTDGQYSVQVSAQGCETTDTINVSFTTAPSIDTLKNVTICEGATFTASLDASLGDITWSTMNTGPQETFSRAGEYFAIIDQGDCVANDTFVLSVTSLGLDLGKDTTICENGSVLLTADIGESGAIYSWSDGSSNPNLNVNSSGNYFVDVVSGACNAKDTIEINIDALPPLGLNDNYTICSGDSLLLDLAPLGLEINWSTLDTLPYLNITTGGAYSLTASNGNCSADFSFNIDVTLTPMIALGNDTIICDDSPIALIGGPIDSASYSWSDGSNNNTLMVTESGVYTLEANNNGCIGTDTINIGLGGIPELGISENPMICEGDSLTLDLGDLGANITWSTGSTTSSESFKSPGEYYLNVLLDGCTASDTFTLSVTPSPIPQLGEDTTLCIGAILSLDVSDVSGADLEWSSGESTTSINRVITGDELIIVNAIMNGCTGSDSLMVTSLNSPVFDLGNPIDICEGEEVILSVDNALPVIWSNGSTGNTLVVSQGGKYFATADNGTCDYTDSIEVNLSAIQALNLGNDTVICSTSPLLLDVTVNNGSYNWSDGSTNGTLLVSNSGEYVVEVFDGFCDAKDTIEIQVENCVAVNLFIPNAFSPNDDGINDDFQVFIEPDVQIQSFELLIFDRWGSLLFRSDDASRSWNGKAPSTSAFLKSDVYVYSMQMTYVKKSNQFTIRRSGDVFLAN